MTKRKTAGLTLSLALALAVGLACDACDALAPVVVTSAPVNACPAHPCAAYTQSGVAPSCDDGACTVAATEADLLLVIGLAADSIFAPGRTYVTTLGREVAATGTCALQNCSPPTCKLVEWALDTNSYLIEPSAANQVAWYLGNPGKANPTALPVHAIYRPLIGPSMADAIDLGLPLDPVQGLNVTTNGTGGFPGPNGGAALQFQAYLQPGCYERTLQPYSPFSKAFPPEIKLWTQASGGPDTVFNFDETNEERLPMGLTTPTVPTFEIARAEGLDGWTAYLRSVVTKRLFSNVAPLSGSLARNVVLATNHLSDQVRDALDGLELVVAPPAGTPMPTEVFAPLGMSPSRELPAHLVYPSLPLPVTMSGRLATAQGAPVAADLVFTATDIFGRTGQPYPPNFEFVARVRSTTDPRTGGSTYTVVLPQGDYAVAVRPLAASGAVTMATRTVGKPGNKTSSEDFTVEPLVALLGSALVADGRPLSDAVVEALPRQCAPNVAPSGPSLDASSIQAIALPAVSDACMPRAVQTITSADGSFALSLDPGGYLLRVRPVGGSRFPWMKQSLTIDPASGPMTLDPIRIPAPVRFGMALTDKYDNKIAEAVVRVFTDPSRGGPAVELGRAITDSNGNYEMVLAPPAP